MAAIFGTATYWREHAEESRAIAEDMRDDACKLAMMAVADSYEQLAKVAEARATSGLLPR